MAPIRRTTLLCFISFLNPLPQILKLAGYKQDETISWTRESDDVMTM